MSTVTYIKQPGIEKSKGTIPLVGTSHVYKVKARLWPRAVEDYLKTLFIGRVLHVCCGKSKLGDVRCDLYEPIVDVRLDAARLPFPDNSFDTLLTDVPYNGKFQWMHDVLNEIHRVASDRIIWQHWFVPANKNGEFRKAHIWKLHEITMVEGIKCEPYVVVEDSGTKIFTVTEENLWSPRTYFGRAQIISVFDRC
jgi:hypothetical protein